MEHVKRCGRRGSDVLHSEHKLIMMLHGSVEYCMRSHVAGAEHIRACIYSSPLYACTHGRPLLD